MQHSINFIGNTYEEISNKRNDQIKFIAKDFFNFAANNKENYHIIENGNDLLVSTWFSDSLIYDYLKSIGKIVNKQ